ncbi:MAG: preprotein translocase subunit SecA [Candidatus Wildermuthbacteria bacterium RIFCSPLOWO2_01_FULL_48_16]|uniref:Protein translocase subunit SecA n=1 Tax=Candidatus Wildermuthbacteria bacterium RIFCSPLOWO2_01_FULL_48_16 TaxID=1802461 RepID=A0A1G2RL93_9BACT|nr:MAG: preprotein translocase subunit SecA [Candidatus Wildermuthbacteria bacterium RIFCSPHIGHO2_02_FULL_49_12b]OHA73614.1 MAG: preprotein translocase subunit SecA [Candidatus Wildermuthbacteria bacterium RIFCSPLOWO2_01_FULL_48_16]
MCNNSGVTNILTKIFGDASAQYLKKASGIAEKVTALEKGLQSLSLEDLRGKSLELKKRAEGGETFDVLLPEAFALIRETSFRTLSQRHFDVQLIGGIVLHEGKIAEMKTGEGKTLTATLAAYVNALQGKGVHIVTVNDYLAKRDMVWMGQIYHALGMSVSCIMHDASYIYDPAYQAEKSQIPMTNDQTRDTVGGFKVVESFLRPVSRKEAYAADITYGTNNEFGFDYLRDNMVYDLTQQVQRGHSFAIVDEVDSILIDEARTPLIISAPDTESSKWYLEFAKIIPGLKAQEDFEVDEKLRAVTLTDGGITKIEKTLGVQDIYQEKGITYLHHLEQALKAQILFEKDKDYVVKDGQVIIVDEFTGRLLPGRRYSGGLHQALEAKERVNVQPESLTLASITFQNYFRMYGKLAGMTGTAATSAEEFSKVYNLDVVVVPTNKPMVRKDMADRIYKNQGAKFEAVVREVQERHQKGQPVLVGTVSIQRNETLSSMFKRVGIPHEVLNAKNHEREGEIIAQAGKPGAVTVATNMAGRGVDIILGGNPQNDPEQQRRVVELGGLHVIGTERHEARRIDNQLRGRSGRQGDPGSSQFFVSLEDDLARVFGGDRLKGIMEKLHLPDDEAIESGMVSSAIESAQSRIEGFNFDARKHLLEYDDVLNKHREVLYKKRKEFLEQATQGALRPQILEMIEKAGFTEEEFEKKEKEIEEVNMRQAEKLISLRTLDSLWIEHLENMEYLRDSVRLRAYGQQDPLVEYKNEGHKAFKALLENFEQLTAKYLMSLALAPNQSAPQQQVPSEPKVGRNDPCPCGSGKKYKKCHGK